MQDFLIIFLGAIILDAIWLGLIAKKFYKENLLDIFGANKFSPRLITSSLVVYILIAGGLTTFVLNPKLSLINLIIKGAFFGLITYGVYDFTNYATLRKYKLKLAIIDCLWGIILCSLLSISYFFLNLL
jgi:uncharacterized membrane protein